LRGKVHSLLKERCLVSRGLIFWVIMLLLLLVWLAAEFGSWALGFRFSPVVVWILLALLGWNVYGPAVKP
jgi:hypothetical protein